MDAPTYSPPPPTQQVDPAVAAADASAQAADQAAMQTKAQMDTAAVMARYGTSVSLKAPETFQGSSPLTTSLAPFNSPVTNYVNSVLTLGGTRPLPAVGVAA